MQHCTKSVSSCLYGRPCATQKPCLGFPESLLQELSNDTPNFFQALSRQILAFGKIRNAHRCVTRVLLREKIWSPDVQGDSIICASIRPSRLTLRVGNLDLDVNGWFCQAPWFKMLENDRTGKHLVVWTRDMKCGVSRSRSSQCRSIWPCEMTMPRTLSMNDPA
jgi:hypothetical protein